MNAEEWTGRTGESWAEEWKRTDRSFTVLTGHMLDRMRAFKFGQVLDIGSGAGELSLAIGRAHPEARVIGVDVSPQLVAVAAERGSRRGNVSFACADAASWEPPPDFAPDLIVSRHGVMFFDNPAAAFGHLAKISSPQVRLLFSCFRSPAENPFFTEVGALLPSSALPPPAGGPGPFAFAETEHVAAILQSGGWRDFAFESYDFGMIAGAGDDPVAEAVAYYSRIGPAARALRELPPHQREQFVAKLAGLMATHRSEGIVALRAATWLVSASKA